MKLLLPISYFFESPKSKILELDTENGQTKCLLELPPTSRDVVGKGITSLGWISTNQLVACDFNSIFIIDSSTWKITKSNKGDELNDLHHLSVKDDRVFLVNTGRDSIDVFDFNLNLIERYDGLNASELSGRLEGGYSINGDYYDRPCINKPFHCLKVPDKWHFNHIAVVNDQLITTSLKTKQLINPVNFQPLCDPLPDHPHDGYVHDEFIWVTTVSGKIYRSPLSKPFYALIFFLVLTNLILPLIKDGVVA